MKNLSRFLTLWLALALGLPSPALALRATGLEESNQQPVLARELGVPAVGQSPGLIVRVQGWHVLRGARAPTRDLLQRFERTDPQRGAVRAQIIRFAKWLAFHHRMNPRGVLRFGLPVVNELSPDPTVIPQHLVALEWLAARLAERRIYPASYDVDEAQMALTIGVSVTGVSILAAATLGDSVQKGELSSAVGRPTLIGSLALAAGGLLYAMIESTVRTNLSSTISSAGSGVPTIILSPEQFAQLTAAAVRHHAAGTDFRIELLRDPPAIIPVPNEQVLDVSFGKGKQRQSFSLRLSGTGTPPLPAEPLVVARVKAQLAGILAETTPGIVVAWDPWLDRVAATVRQLRAQFADDLKLYEAVAGHLSEAGIAVPPDRAYDVFNQVLHAVAVLRPAPRAATPQPPATESAAPLSASPSTALPSAPPAAAPDAEAELRRRAPDRQREAGLEERQPLTPEAVQILIVDDDPAVLSTTLRLLPLLLKHSQNPLIARIQSAQLHGVGTVAEALAWIPTHQPEVVITDLNLPDGLGFEVARAAQDADPLAAVILASTPLPGQQAEVQQLLEAGTLTRFFQKPVSLRAVMPVIEDHLGPRLTAGMEEDPIAAALTQGPVAIEVDAGGVARINGQGEPITIPPELKQPGFFEPGSRTIVVREAYDASPTFVMLDQIGIKSWMAADPPWLPNHYVNLTRVGITTPPALLKEIGGWARRTDSIAAVFRTPFLDPAQAQRAARRFQQLTLVGVPEDGDIFAEQIGSLLRAAQLQNRVLYLTRLTPAIFQQHRVLLIAA